jgi:hypothetical protein
MTEVCHAKYPLSVVILGEIAVVEVQECQRATTAQPQTPEPAPLTSAAVGSKIARCRRGRRALAFSMGGKSVPLVTPARAFFSKNGSQGQAVLIFPLDIIPRREYIPCME